MEKSKDFEIKYSRKWYGIRFLIDIRGKFGIIKTIKVVNYVSFFPTTIYIKEIIQ